MAEEALVESVVLESIRLVKELDKQGIQSTKVLWYFFSDAEEWRLLVAGPPFDELLPREEARAYQKLAPALREARLESLSIADVKLIRTDDPLLKALKFVKRTPANDVVRAHFRNNTFDGVFVKEMLILRAA